MGNDYFMGGPTPYRPMGYAPSFLLTQMAPQPQQMNNNSNIMWTMGLESAKAYPLMPGKTMMLMDSESPRFFIKTVDNNGYATIKSYAFQEEKTNMPENKYVTQEQFDAAINALMEQMRQKAPTNVEEPKPSTETKSSKNLL